MPEVLPDREIAAPGIVEETPTEPRYAYLKYSGSIASSTGKIPDCSDVQPTRIKYRMTDSAGSEQIIFSEVTMKNGEVNQIEPIKINPDAYSVLELSLTDDAENILYTMPELSDDFPYSEGLVPFEIVASEGEDVMVTGGLFCISSNNLAIPVTVAGYVDVYAEPFQQAYFEIFSDERELIGNVLIYVDGVERYNIDVKNTDSQITRGGDVYRFIIPQEFETLELVTPYETVLLTEYNADGILTWDDDVIRFFYFQSE